MADSSAPPSWDIAIDAAASPQVAVQTVISLSVADDVFVRLDPIMPSGLHQAQHLQSDELHDVVGELLHEIDIESAPTSTTDTDIGTIIHDIQIVDGSAVDDGGFLQALLPICVVVDQQQQYEQMPLPVGGVQEQPVATETIDTKKRTSAIVTCTICNITLKNQKNLRSHMQTHGGNKNFHCTLCPKSFLRSNQLKSHQKVHTGERPYECTVCHKTFAQSSNYLVHRNTHLDVRAADSPGGAPAPAPFRCDECGRTFAQQLYLKAHMRVHTERDPLRCRLCRRKYERPADLAEHQREHVAANRFRCLVCDKEFERYINLKNHRFTHNGLKPYACSVCGKRFSHTTSMAVHMRTHTGEKPYECTHCDGRFSQWANYHRHLATHERERQEHECDQCGKRFAKSSSLKGHQRTHAPKADAHDEQGADENGAEPPRPRRPTTSRRLKCEICGGRFSSVRQVRRHMTDEHGAGGDDEEDDAEAAAGARLQRPHLLKCDECDEWADELTLEVHVRTEHPTYLRHGCPHCRQDFAHTDQLLVHLRDHLGQKQCEQCGKMFRKIGLYKRHQCIRAAYEREMRERQREESRRLALRRQQANANETGVDGVGDSSDNEEKNAPIDTKQTAIMPATVAAVDQSPSSVCSRKFSTSKRMHVHSKTHSDTEENNAQYNRAKSEPEMVDNDCIDDILSYMTSDEQPIETKQTLAEIDPPPTTTKPYTCSTCPRQFSSAKRLQVHAQTHGDRRFRCDQCPLTFVRASELTSHRRSHTGERPFQCEICSKCFTQSSALYTHQRVHTGERPFGCSICAKRFKQSSACKRHEALHSGVKPFMCQRCGKAFANADGLQIHARSHDRPPREKRAPRPRPLRAPRPLCAPKAAAAAAASRKHQELGANGYYGDLPYACDVCRKTFAKACTLWVHAKIHTGERNHRCDQCPKAFAQAANLRRHQRSHNGRRPHQCFECTKWFAQRETLDAHMELHRRREREAAASNEPAAIVDALGE